VGPQNTSFSLFVIPAGNPLLNAGKTVVKLKRQRRAIIPAQAIGLG
jgi:hypothetical protein